MTRVLTAAALLPLLWLSIKRAPAFAFYALVGLVMLIAAWECYALLEAKGSRPLRGLGLAGCLAVTGSFAYTGARVNPALPLVLVTIVAIAGAMWRRGDPAAMLETAGATLFPVLFVGLTLGYPIALRALPGENATDLLLLLALCVMAGDTAAFYFGSKFGRHRMAPKVSPKKSWEGAAGGVVASVAGAVLAHFWFFLRLPLAHAVALGVVLSLTGILGDLAESMLKRAAGVKDSSALLPGHGGVLDRLDSLLVAAPVLYYYWSVFLAGVQS